MITREQATFTDRDLEAIDAYQRQGLVHLAATREEARAGLVDRWDRDRQAAPEATRIILTHANAEVCELNGLARSRLRVTPEPWAPTSPTYSAVLTTGLRLRAGRPGSV